MNPEQMIYVGVKLTTDRMTDQEIAAIYNAATAGFDPRAVQGYDKAEHLFTEDRGTRMHQTVLDAWGAIINERLGEAG